MSLAQLLNPSLALLLSPSVWLDPRSPTCSAFPPRALLSPRVSQEAEGKQLDRCLGAGAAGGAEAGLMGHRRRGFCCMEHHLVLTAEDTGLPGTTAGSEHGLLVPGPGLGLTPLPTPWQLTGPRMNISCDVGALCYGSGLPSWALDTSRG